MWKRIPEDFLNMEWVLSLVIFTALDQADFEIKIDNGNFYYKKG